jgi:hypothetical protein
MPAIAHTKKRRLAGPMACRFKHGVCAIDAINSVHGAAHFMRDRDHEGSLAALSSSLLRFFGATTNAKETSFACSPSFDRVMNA